MALARDMRELSALLDFGPGRAGDHRLDRLRDGSGVPRPGRRASRRSTSRRTAVHVLSHKVREKFNEGAKPEPRDSPRSPDPQHCPALAAHAPARQSASGTSGRRPLRCRYDPRFPAFTPVRLSDSAGVPDHRRIRERAGSSWSPSRTAIRVIAARSLPTADHLRIWANTIDGNLAALRKPRETYSRSCRRASGRWYARYAPSKQLDMQVVPTGRRAVRAHLSNP
jgi:hypothetical protein